MLRDYIINVPGWYADLIEDTENREDFINWIIDLYGGDKAGYSGSERWASI